LGSVQRGLETASGQVEIGSGASSNIASQIAAADTLAGAAEPQAVRPLGFMMSSSSASRLPRRMLFAFVGLTVLLLAVALAHSLQSGWVPPRAWSGVVLPFYFAALLAALTLSFVISGDTLMHHVRTGTVRRASDPLWFWSIVTAQSTIAAILIVIGYLKWKSLHG
jgi:hypothetical protein